GYAVAQVPDHREVMRDEELGHLHLVLKLPQQVDDLRPDRHVERAYRLVCDYHRGVQRERSGQPHALPLPAGQLVRVTPGMSRRQPDYLKQIADALATLRPGSDMVHAKRLRDARADPPLRVERRCRILEDHLELGSPRVPPGGTLRAKWQPAKENRPGRRWKQAH